MDYYKVVYDKVEKKFVAVKVELYKVKYHAEFRAEQYNKKLED